MALRAKGETIDAYRSGTRGKAERQRAAKDATGIYAAGLDPQGPIAETGDATPHSSDDGVLVMN